MTVAPLLSRAVKTISNASTQASAFNARRHRPNEIKMGDGHRERASLEGKGF
jgi:hypothetical protein